MSSSKKWWRKFVPFPRRKTLRRWFPPFEDKKIAHLIGVSRADVVVDIGANTGQFGQMLRACGYTGRIVSFEPLPPEHAGLEALSANDPNWTIAPRMALGAETGEITINRYTDTSLSSALAPAVEASGFAVAEKITADLNRLDDVIGDLVRPEDTLFVKVDVQGLEMQVFAGGAQTMGRASGALVELALSRIYQNEPGYLEVLGALDGFGLTPVYFAHVTAKKKMGPEKQMDALLLRR
ncbi:MAG: FkbM family methyltransferase [Pseudomonadota bacterium]